MRSLDTDDGSNVAFTIQADDMLDPGGFHALLLYSVDFSGTTNWISKWVDYAEKYGLGYQLSTGCVGVMFNDGSNIVASPDLKYVWRLSEAFIR